MGIEPLWLHLAECAWLHLLSLGCLRRHTTWAIVTKALQLVTRYPPGPGYGQADPIAWTRAALETAGVKPLDVPESLPGGGGRPVQLVIDEAQDLNRAQVVNHRRPSAVAIARRHRHRRRFIVVNPSSPFVSHRPHPTSHSSTSTSRNSGAAAASSTATDTRREWRRRAGGAGLPSFGIDHRSPPPSGSTRSAVQVVCRCSPPRASRASSGR